MLSDSLLLEALSQTPSQAEIADNLYILDKEQRLVRYTPNRVQRHFRENKTGRDLVLKSRQQGVSTEIQAFHYELAVTQSVMIATLAHDADTTQKLRRMAKRFHENLPDYLRPARSADNATTTIYANTGSEVTIATAGSRDVGRGGTYSHVHGSETAFWKDAEAIIAGLLQGVPKHGEIVLESTPNGASGWLYERAMEALAGNGIWTLHFYPWWWADEYAMPLDDGEIIDPTADEIRLITEHGLTAEQIKWRRVKQNELGRLFIQEYPEDAVDCFLRSGTGFFATIPHLDKLFDASQSAVPNGDHNIVAGLDLGQADDFTALSIFDADTGHELRLHRINKRPWSEIWRKVGEWCKAAHVKTLVIETNTLGGIDFIDVRRQLVAAGYNGNVLKYTTSSTTKPKLIAGFYTALDKEQMMLLKPTGAKNDAATVGKAEMYDFTSTQTPSGAWKYEASTGHDDTVIARALAWYGASRPPRWEPVVG